MKYIVVGTSHSGYEVIQTLLKEDENADIQVFESADQPSFLSCGIQSYLEDISSSLDDLHYASVDSYKAQGVNIHTNSTVTDLDTDNKTVVVEHQGQTATYSYDKLFLVANLLPLQSMELKNINMYYLCVDVIGQIKLKNA